MFRQTLCLLSLFLTAAPQVAAIIDRVASYQLCTGNVNQYVSPIGQGGFTFPVYGGACPVANGTLPVGVLSGTCSQNPYAGRAMTYIRASTFPVLPVQDPAPAPAAGTAAMQALANGWCLGANGPSSPMPLASLCYADLGVRGTDVKVKNPGSKLGFTFNTRTTYQFVGAIYETDTQSTLTQTSTAFVSITCQYVAASITSTDGGMPFEGSGKYKQPFLEKHIAGIDQIVTRMSPLPVVANPTNIVLNTPDVWRTQLTVRYSGKGYVNFTQL